MKKSIILIILLSSISGFSQLVQGEIKVKEQSKIEIAAKSNKAVNLYADFRENKYPIQFTFTGNSIALNSDKKMVVQFVFTTTVKKDGKIIGTIKRNPIPFFPGDMLMPVETFDFISILSNQQTNSEETISEIPKGNYEILLEVKPVGIKGEIASARLYLKI
ncbi:hypothetical protein M0M57_08125 [Flavobacterium azooxidireducens]|uniref:DUF4625 domain-containing protein n=1 Tax=Flavobacterium azooxidireducens TaxID=1871076 RepID=A0ABY4KJE5_9FLAO|nr:hypothetical protein [Flavobacterium azooxidireducens]UPQ80794.1 hypothetical protein M0M57_08125 [Flavobacterium azooxidireducens]